MISPTVLARQRGEKVRRHRRTGCKPGVPCVDPCPVPGCTNKIAVTNTLGVCHACQRHWRETVRKLLGVIREQRTERAA